MSKKKDALKEVLVKARALSEIDERTEEQEAELAGHMTAAKSLRDDIVRDTALDDFASNVVDEVEPSKPVTKNEVALGFDGGLRGRPVVVADRKGWESTVKAWQSGDKGAKWGFDVRYKAGVDDATAEVGFGDTTFVGAAPGDNQYGGVVSPFYYPGIIEPPTRMPMVSDLFAQGQTSSNLIRLVKETFTSADGNGINVGGHGVHASAEGAPYGQIKLEVSPVDWPVRDITGLLPVTEDILMDIPAMASYLSMRLSKFVQLAEEGELVNGDSTGNHLEGLLELENTTVDSQGGFDIDTAVMRLMARTYKRSFMDPSWVLMSPHVWARYVTLRTDLNGGLGAFLSGVPTQAAARTIWGLPITVTPVVPDDKIVMGNPAEGMIFRNGGLRVESSTGYGTFFGEGLVAIRGKVRTAFAHFRPQAIGVLDLAS
jgi:HK97 family phage major capsid protein